MTPLNKWDLRFMCLAVLVSSWSKDPKKQVGAVFVSPDRRQQALGYNGLPRGIADQQLLDLADSLNLKKNDFTVHAEANGILNAVQDLVGWSLYVTKPPCIECSLLLIQKRIKVVYFPKLDKTSSWYNEQQKARLLLESSNVTTVETETEEWQ